MNNEPNKPIQAQELTEKELEDIVGGARECSMDQEMCSTSTADSEGKFFKMRVEIK